ncbi:MAG: molybdate ABC transporter substrate-binding protein [Chloroflexi bacterium]|nr:molybdate ABC transporter substrate-binding protein [Chloroflexota bacterium]
MHARLFVALMILLATIGGASAQNSPSRNLTVFAATSLTDVFESLRAAFIETNPDFEILLNFSSSSTLAAQLIQGAPADIFASANELQMDLVVEGGLIAADAINIFAHNQLVLITPADNPAGIESVWDLTDESVLLVLAAEGTPIRAYTDEMIASHNADYGEGFFESVMRNLVSEESNVRQVVTRVALGEADAGIVYQSDALGDIAAQLLTIEIDPRHNQLASYPIAPLIDGENSTLAQSFIDFLLSEDAQLIFAEYGFCSPAILTEVPPEDQTPELTLEADDAAETPNNFCPAPTPVSR